MVNLLFFLTNPIARPVWTKLAMVLNILKNNNHIINTNHLEDKLKNVSGFRYFMSIF